MKSEIVKDKKALALSIAKRYFHFLFVSHKADVINFAQGVDFILCGKIGIKEASNLIQRHLYRIAVENGYRRQRGGGWVKKEKTNKSERF